MTSVSPEKEIESLQNRLREAEETIDAIRSGDVDAVVVAGPDGSPQIYTLETADQTYRALVEEMQEGALTLSLDGTILYCNRRFAELTGEDFSRVVGTPLTRFIVPSERNDFDRVAAACGKGEFNIRSARKVADTPTHLSFAMLPAGDGKPDALCCIVTDLSEQKAVNDALLEAHQKLIAEVDERERAEGLLRQSQKMEVVGQMTGGVAHDFNNLLMAVSAGLNLLESQTDPEKLKRIKQGMRDSIERGATLTRQLLTFSRTKDLQAIPTDLVSQIDGMRELLDRSLRANIKLVTEYDPDIWPVKVDVGEFELVLLNLCINARDAMPNGGTITIKVHNASLSEKALSGDFVCITLTDTGTGMSSETVAHAFEPFFTTKDVGKGSGLGLAQAYGFAQASGGRLTIESKLDVGTTLFLALPRSLELPVIQTQTGATARSKTISQRPVHGHVLLVEDEEEVAEFIQQMLANMGLTVTRVATAKAALGALANGREIDLVFSDIMMPGGMNGVELARRIRDRSPHTPVILTSGHASAYSAEAKAMGIELLAKPYSNSDLAEVINRTLPRRDGIESNVA
jgi:PAS domain S-box-containing protein